MEFVGGSEIDPVKRCLLQSVHRSCKQKTYKEAFERDIFDRDLSDTPESDLYISGFPCPAYSTCGVKKGAKDGKGRGLLIFEGLKYVTYRRPSLVILEQVAGFTHKRHSRTHKVMQKCFHALKYKVYFKKLTTQEHGIPQSRTRCYFVAFRKKAVKFRFPESLPKPALGTFLDKSKGTEKVDLASYEQKFGENIWQEELVLDIGSSPKWQSKMTDVSPCLTRGRCLQKGYYLPHKLRRLNGCECARLQGVPAKVYEEMLTFLMRKMDRYSKEDVAEKQIMGALGDSMSVNVLMRLFFSAIIAAGLKPSGLALKDPWAKAVAGKRAHTLADKLWANMG
eukprot:Skav207800  [mRNA]  locus=scaffold710:614346:615356:+ [translate_table: standard]